MNKILIFVAGLMATFGLLAGRVQAAGIFDQVDCSGVSSTNTLCADVNTGKTKNSLYGSDGILTKAASFLAVISGIIGIIMLIIGGLKFVNSGGDSSKVASGRNTIIYAIVGMVVAASAQIIATFILSRLK